MVIFVFRLPAKTWTSLLPGSGIPRCTGSLFSPGEHGVYENRVHVRSGGYVARRPKPPMNRKATEDEPINKDGEYNANGPTFNGKSSGKQRKVLGQVTTGIGSAMLRICRSIQEAQRGTACVEGCLLSLVREHEVGH